MNRSLVGRTSHPGRESSCEYNALTAAANTVLRRLVQLYFGDRALVPSVRGGSLRVLVTFDLDGVLMQNPFRRGVFPHVVRALEPYASAIAARETGADPARLVLQLIIDEARQRLLDGRMVEAYDWDDIVARVAADLASQARGARRCPALPQRDSPKPRFSLPPWRAITAQCRA